MEKSVFLLVMGTLQQRTEIFNKRGQCMFELEGVTKPTQYKILGVSTLAFTTCFAVWTIFSIIGLKIKQDLGLNDTQFGLLVATPILTGSLSRIFLGIWTDQYGGRIIYFVLMLATAAAVWSLASVETYVMFLVAALGVGLAGGSFAVGIAYVSRWYEKAKARRLEYSEWVTWAPP